MKHKGISVIVILSCILLVVQGNEEEMNEEEFNVLHTAINSFTNIVVRYHIEFDTKVKFGPLQEVLTKIDRAMLGYQGTAKKKLDETRKFNSDARLAYEDCVGPVFEWCVGINGTLDIIIKYLDDLELTNGDRDVIWDLTVELVKQGEAKVSNSIELLKEVQFKMNKVKNMLDSMLHDLNNDFSPDGYYGVETTKLENAIADEKQAIKREQEKLEATRRELEAQRSNKELEARRRYSFIDFIYDVVVAAARLLGSIVRTFLGRKRRMIDVHTSHIKTYEQKIKFIKEFFKDLNSQINLASKIATEINLSLTEDKMNLYALRGIIKTTDNNKQLMKLSPKLRAKLIPSFQTLGNKCYDYALWHGYGSERYRHNHARARRQAIETCNTQRSKAITTITESIASNVTNDSKNHLIFNLMNCGSTSPENEHSALHLAHKNSGPILIGGTTKNSLLPLDNPLEKKSF